MKEQWKPIPGYEGRYEASSLGRIKSLPRTTAYGRKIQGRVLSENVHPSGHITVKLSKDGEYLTGKVHRLVLTAFHGQAPPGCETLHGDGNPANNRIENLSWGTRSENHLDRVRHGTHHMANRTHCPHGHPYNNVNTHVTRDGRRMCRECLRRRNAESRRRQRETKNLEGIVI